MSSLPYPYLKPYKCCSSKQIYCLKTGDPHQSSPHFCLVIPYLLATHPSPCFITVLKTSLLPTHFNHHVMISSGGLIYFPIVTGKIWGNMTHMASCNAYGMPISLISYWTFCMQLGARHIYTGAAHPPPEPNWINDVQTISADFHHIRLIYTCKHKCLSTNIF